MVEYLTDIDLTTDLDIHLNSANDIELSSGRDNLEQGIALSTMTVTRRAVGGKITATNLSLLEQRVTEYLDQDPHVGDVQQVETETVNRESGVVTMRIDLTENESFEIQLSE